MFWSEIGSEFGDPGGNPTKDSLEYPTGLFRLKNLVCMTYGGYTIFVQYVGVEAKLRMSENLLYD